MQVKQTFFGILSSYFVLLVGIINSAYSSDLIDISDESCYNHSSTLNERHSLIELIQNEDNIAAHHPWLVMNAAQRALSLCLYKESQRINDFEYGEGKVNYYPVFSEGIPEANGLGITGQLRAIETFVDYVNAAAQGDGSASKMLLFVGPSP